MEYPSDEVMKVVYQKWNEMTEGREEDTRPMQAVLEDCDRKLANIEENLFLETLAYNEKFERDMESMNRDTEDSKPSNVVSKNKFEKPPTGLEIHQSIVKRAMAKDRKKITNDAKRMRKEGKILPISDYFSSKK